LGVKSRRKEARGRKKEKREKSSKERRGGGGGQKSHCYAKFWIEAMYPNQQKQKRMGKLKGGEKERRGKKRE